MPIEILSTAALLYEKSHF